jgi:hypothetical protein
MSPLVDGITLRQDGQSSRARIRGPRSHNENEKQAQAAILYPADSRAARYFGEAQGQIPQEQPRKGTIRAKPEFDKEISANDEIQILAKKSC